MPKVDFSYEQLTKKLHRDPKDPLLSELHGYICGIICGSRYLKDQQLFQPVLNRLREENLSKKSEQKIFAQLMIKSFQELHQPDCKFQLILPDDESPIKLRIKMLSLWCQGFQSGLGETGITQKDINQSEIQEALNDISMVSHIYSQLAQSKIKEEDECSYVDIVEHVRICVMLIYTKISLP